MTILTAPPRPLLGLVFLAGPVFADGTIVGQIYAPYVQPLEKEIELVVVDEHGGTGIGRRRDKLGFGTSLAEHWYTELSVTSVDEGGERYEELEIEAIWQLTEQGEYSSDWGLLLEAETALGQDANELSIGVINQKDLGRWSVLSNLVATYEWGSDRSEELETQFALQTRYRHSPGFEPTLEFYVGQDTRALGPGATGVIKMLQGRQLRWNLGLLKNIGNPADYTVKLEFEYEFF